MAIIIKKLLNITPGGLTGLRLLFLLVILLSTFSNPVNDKGTKIIISLKKWFMTRSKDFANTNTIKFRAALEAYNDLLLLKMVPMVRPNMAWAELIKGDINICRHFKKQD